MSCVAASGDIEGIGNGMVTNPARGMRVRGIATTPFPSFWIALAGGVLVLLALAAGASGEARSWLRAAYLLDGLMRPPKYSPALFASLASDVTSTRQHATYGEQGGNVEIDVYRPLDAQDAPLPALMLVPGFTRLGLEDPSVKNLARLFAGMGLAVAVPQFARTPRAPRDAGHSRPD
jgi:hypothetical protein